jgi:hypothetical protein
LIAFYSSVERRLKMLRQFLYLNGSLTDEFLAQIEGGIYEDEAQTLVERTSKEFGGRLRAGPVTGGGARTRGDEQQTTRTLSKTPESGFARLADYLRDSDELLEVGELNEETWGSIRSGEIVELHGSVAVASFVKFAQLAQQAARLLSLLQTMGEETDAETEAAMAGFAALGQTTRKVPAVVRAAEAKRYKFIASLEADNVRVGLDELEGEATLFAKIQRKLGSTERHTVLDDLAGLSNLPREERRKIQRGLKNDASMPDAVISPPAAVVTPIAIF